MATRPLELSEYRQIMELMLTGFVKKSGNVFHPNRQIAFALLLESNLGLRIGDILNLRVNSFRSGKLELREKKTDKLQYRDINPDVYNYVMDYIIDKGLSKTDKLFDITVRSVQRQLKIAVDYLELENIGTHSFRKMFATTVYEDNGRDIGLLKEVLNHASIATTQRYIRISQAAINQASSNIKFL